MKRAAEYLDRLVLCDLAGSEPELPGSVLAFAQNLADNRRYYWVATHSERVGRVVDVRSRGGSDGE